MILVYIMSVLCFPLFMFILWWNGEDLNGQTILIMMIVGLIPLLNTGIVLFSLLLIVFEAVQKFELKGRKP